MNIEWQKDLAERTPYYHYLGIELLELSDGFATMKIEFREQLTHPFGYFHGGVIASLADSAGINSAFTMLDNGENAVTFDIKVNYLAPAKDTSLYAEAKVIYKGKRFILSDVNIKGEDGNIVAKATVTCAVF